MSCTQEKPCQSPILRWVHSDRCNIDTLSAMAGDLRKRVRELEGALTKIAAKDRECPDDDDGDAECAECHTVVQTADGLEPAPECHPCSTTLLGEARMIARRVLSGEGG